MVHDLAWIVKMDDYFSGYRGFIAAAKDIHNGTTQQLKVCSAQIRCRLICILSIIVVVTIAAAEQLADVDFLVVIGYICTGRDFDVIGRLSIGSITLGCRVYFLLCIVDCCVHS